MAITIKNNATSCVVNAFVDATPISGPACVKKTSSESLVKELSATLQMAKVLKKFDSFAKCSAANVSAVSPD